MDLTGLLLYPQLLCLPLPKDQRLLLAFVVFLLIRIVVFQNWAQLISQTARQLVSLAVDKSGQRKTPKKACTTSKIGAVICSQIILSKSLNYLQQFLLLVSISTIYVYSIYICLHLLIVTYTHLSSLTRILYFLRREATIVGALRNFYKMKLKIFGSYL